VVSQGATEVALPVHGLWFVIQDVCSIIDGIRSDILGDNGIGSDDGCISNADTGQDFCATTDPDIVANIDRAGRAGGLPSCAGIFGMVDRYCATITVSGQRQLTCPV